MQQTPHSLVNCNCLVGFVFFCLVGNQNRVHTQSLSKLHVCDGITYYDGATKVDVWEVTLGLLGHSGLWLAADRTIRTGINLIYFASGGGNTKHHLLMNICQILEAHQLFMDPQLIGHNDDPTKVMWQQGKGI